MTRPASDVLADLAALATRQAALLVELASALRAPAAAPPRPADTGAEYVTSREAARLLGLSPRTLEGLRARGHGPEFIRIGRAVRYRRDALSAVQLPSSEAPAAPSAPPRF